MEDQQARPGTHAAPGEAVSRRALLRIGAVAGLAALFALTACGVGGGGDDEDDEDDD